MKRLLRIFALLTAASMLIWIAGCGDDDDDDDDAGPVPKVVSVSIAEGGSVGGTQPIQVTFSKKVDDGNITIAVSGATGSVAWDAAGICPGQPQAGSLSITASNPQGQRHIQGRGGAAGTQRPPVCAAQS